MSDSPEDGKSKRNKAEGDWMDRLIPPLLRFVFWLSIAGAVFIAILDGIGAAVTALTFTALVFFGVLFAVNGGSLSEKDLLFLIWLSGPDKRKSDGKGDRK